MEEGSSSDKSGFDSGSLDPGDKSTSKSMDISLIGMVPPEKVLKMITDGGTKLLGLGAFGAVFSGIYLDSAVAVKIMKMQQPNDPAVQQAFREEIEKLMQRPSEHIIGYRGACLDPVKVTYFDSKRKQENSIEGIAIVMELATGGDMEHLLRNKKGNEFKVPLSLYQKIVLARDTARGLAWLHCGFDAPIIHRDLATKNVFISKQGNMYRAKLGDLGLAKTIPTGVASDEGEGTCSIRAPEVLANVLEEGKVVQYDHRIDLYSFGVVLWEILTRKKAYLGKLFDIFNFVHLICEEHYREPIPHDTLPRLKNLIEMLWSHDPAARLPPGKDTSWIVSELEQILIEVAIEDEHGREFWRKNFFKRHNIPWKEFAPKFYELLALPLPQDPVGDNRAACLTDSGPGYAPLLELLISEKAIARQGKKNLNISSPKPARQLSHEVIELRCLKALLAKRAGVENKLYVSLLDFGRLLNRVSPLISEGETFLQRITVLLSNKWFHGDIPSEEAMVLLKHQKVGVYLVRFGSIPPEADLPPKNCFSLMVKTYSETVKKLQLIKNSQTGKWNVSGAEYKYDSLEQTVEKLCKDLGLTIPCPPHPFADIFAAESSSHLSNN